MKIRRFYSSNLRSALKQVTDEIGVDAAILSNKKVAGGVEVIAAVDYDESLMPSLAHQSDRKESVIKSSETRSVVSSSGESVGQAKDIGKKSIEKNDRGIEDSSLQTGKPIGVQQIKAFRMNETSAQQSASARDIGSNVVTNIGSKSADNRQSTKTTIENMGEVKRSVEWGLDPNLSAMKEELSLMRSMMSEQLKGMAWSHFTERDPTSAMIMRRLSELGLDNDMLNCLLPHIENQADAECAWQQVLALITKSIPVENSGLLDKGGVYALMGPTGVGKTTTIAKLAARFIIKHGVESVALITTDSYRIAAQEQITTFGRILQIPTSKVSERCSLSSLLKEYSNKKLVLIDTAGVSENNTNMISALKELSNVNIKVKKLLLMSASSQGAVLAQSLKIFNTYKPDGIIVTKLDEAACLGELLSVVIKSHIPVEYTTDGQRIPEDIREAKSHQLLAKAVCLANKYRKQVDDWSLAQSFEHANSA